MPMAGTNPDSALSLLNHIDQGQLVEEEMAKYALSYYMAQDKSGLDVDDNDSLIRTAFNWYSKHQEDTLYATSLYYMGKCFMLNDSMEQAAACMERSYAISNSLQNMNVKCLALDKLIEIEEQLSLFKALNDAKDLVKMYDAMPDASTYNKGGCPFEIRREF